MATGKQPSTPIIIYWEEGNETFLVQTQKDGLVLPWATNEEGAIKILKNFGVESHQRRQLFIDTTQPGIDPVIKRDFERNELEVEVWFIRKREKKNGKFFVWKRLDYKAEKSEFIQMIYMSGIHKGIFLGSWTLPIFLC